MSPVTAVHFCLNIVNQRKDYRIGPRRNVYITLICFHIPCKKGYRLGLRWRPDSVVFTNQKLEVQLT